MHRYKFKGAVPPNISCIIYGRQGQFIEGLFESNVFRSLTRILAKPLKYCKGAL
jgi:hypothetical protein